MIHLNLDPTPVAADEIVALTPEASITSLGEVAVGRRRFQARRTVDAKWGRVHDYLVDVRGNGFYLESVPRTDDYVARSRNTGQLLTTRGKPALFRYRSANRIMNVTIA